MQKKIFLIITLIVSCYLSAIYYPPNSNLGMVHSYGFEYQERGSKNQQNWSNLPDSIMIFLVEFEDVKFDSIPDYPDYVSHDRDYFHRLMFHLSSYYSDASHGKYKIISDSDSLYEIYPQIITLPNTMAYYGQDESRDMIESKVEMIQDLIEQVDPFLNFSEYDSYLLFHAGAGQEANPDDADFINSTFLSRKSFQAALDPDNDEFPGILTDDGIYFKEINILPESENKANLEIDATAYGLLGVLAQSFGYQLGLPTLYDNNRDNGLSFGIGSFGVMGYGVWNANGYVPPLPCAWSRYYLGWEDDYLVEISETADNYSIAYPMSANNLLPKLYKISISDKEYFLLENRQQNPDHSYFVNTSGDTLVSFSFEISEDQEYYEEGHPYAGQPKFNFMTNTYAGCEWDFYLPGFGYGDEPENDGSGLLIWHIDENIIEANFLPGYEENSPNGDGNHKGVDLEEADGIQHLDGPMNDWQLGSPDDAYREGNNTYFGKLYPEPGVLSLPTSESYYGGNQMEVSNISESANEMSFSVTFQWYIDAGYIGNNILNATILDLDNDGEEEIFYPMPTGEVYFWDSFELIDNFPILMDPIPYYYSFDEETGLFLVPTYNNNTDQSKLIFINQNSYDYQYFLNKQWAAAPVVNPDQESATRVIAAFNSGNSSEIMFFDADYTISETILFPDEIVITNLILKDNIVTVFTENTTGSRIVRIINLNNMEISVIDDLTESIPSSINSAQKIDLDNDLIEEYVITSDSLLIVYNNQFEIFPEFPLKMDFSITSIPSFADLDSNSFTEIIIGTENSFTVVDHAGNLLKPHLEIDSPDSLNIAAGAIALNLDTDSELEVIGNISRNRLASWNNINNNDFEIIKDNVHSFGELSRNYPIIFTNNGASRIYSASDNGTIFRTELDQITDISWQYEYGNLQRTASNSATTSTNSYLTDDLFVKGQNYFYPNPLNTVFNSSIANGSNRSMTITLNLMTSKDTDVNIKIFDIAGNIISSKNIYCLAYIKTNHFIDADELSSGVYFAVIKGRGKILKRKFAIEK